MNCELQKMDQNLKGIARAYRKTLRRLGVRFPLRGAFYVTRNGRVVPPAEVEATDTIVCGAAPSPSPSPSPPSEFSQLDAQIGGWLRERGFVNRNPQQDYTSWSGQCVFWQQSSGDLWCLALAPESNILFGVYAELLREAESNALQVCRNLADFLQLAGNNPDFPQAIRSIGTDFDRGGREYWGVQIGPTCGRSELFAFIAELVNAFTRRVTSPSSAPWGAMGTRPPPQPGVLNESTKRMPDPVQSPHHGFILTLAEYINSRVPGYGYRSVGNTWVRNNLWRYTGSFSWEGPCGNLGNVVGWKLCYHGHHDWRFGVREELVQANLCLGQQAYDFRFYVPPDNKAVFHGFRVFDTLASRARVEAVINCL